VHAAILGIPFGAKSCLPCDALPVQARGMAAGVNHLAVKAVVVVLPAVECGGPRNADHAILGRILRGKSRVVDRAELRFFDNGGGPFQR
jgi:hypothetical protein